MRKKYPVLDFIFNYWTLVLGVYTVKCHSWVKWFTSIRPLAPRTVRVLDAMPASAVRSTTGWTLVSLA